MQQSQSACPALSNLGAYRQIYTPEEWNGFYPKPTPENSFHYLIARNEKPEQTVKLIQIVKAERIQHLLAKDKGHHDLTPLHIAAMKADALSVDTLTKKLAEVPGKLAEALNARDSFGWTPLHHALLTSEEIFRRLLELGASLNAQTAMEEDCYELQQLIGRVKVQRSLPTTCLVMQEGQPKKLSTLSQEDMQRALGIELYTDSVLYQPEYYRHLWQRQPSDSSSHLPMAAYRNWIKNPPVEFLIRASEELKGKNPMPLSLHVDHAVNAGTALGLHGGLFKPLQGKHCFNLSDYFTKDKLEDAHLFETNDAAHAGNAVKFANFGWPNTLAVHIRDGSSQVILIAGEQIEAKGELRYTYGLTYALLTFGAQALLGAEEMREFFKRRPLTQFFSEYHAHCEKRVINTVTDYAQSQLHGDRLLFPLNCPAALLDLHFRSIVSAKEWENLLSKPEEYPLVTGFLSYAGILGGAVRAMIKRLVQFEERLSNANLRNAIGSWVLKSIGTLTIMQILKGLQILGSDFVNKKLDSDTIERRLHELDSWLKNEYTDWIQDKEGPLNYAYRLQVYIESFQNAPIEQLMLSLLQEIVICRNTGAPESSESIRLLLDLYNNLVECNGILRPDTCN